MTSSWFFLSTLLYLTFVYLFISLLSSSFFSFSFLFLLIEDEFVSVQAMKVYGDCGDNTETLDGRTWTASHPSRLSPGEAPPELLILLLNLLRFRLAVTCLSKSEKLELRFQPIDRLISPRVFVVLFSKSRQILA